MLVSYTESIHRRLLRAGLVIVVALCFAATAPFVQAQSNKAAKEAQSLQKTRDGAKKSTQALVEQLGKMLTGYNQIIDGSAKNVDSSYKKLTSDLKSTEKMIQTAQKDVTAMDKQAQKYFSAWESDLDAISSEDLKAKSQTRLEKSQADYKALGEALTQAGEAFAPLVQNLNDQILFLGRDLSPGAIEDLADEAESLNQQAKDVTEEVESLIQSADAPDPDAG